MAASSGMWQNLRDNVHFAQSSERQRAILMQFGALLAFMVDEAHVGTTARMEFVFRFRLAVFGMSVWDQLEALVSRTLTKYPVSSSFGMFRSDVLTFLPGDIGGCFIPHHSFSLRYRT